MNILFYHKNGIVPTSGGISRITETLGQLFEHKQDSVWYLGLENIAPDYNYPSNQLFLPSRELMADDNIQYVRAFLKSNNIDVIVNQNALNPNSAIFLAKCKKGTKIKLVSCPHNSILTPIYNAAYQKEYILKKSGLSIVFYLMNCKLIKRLMVWSYIRKYRNHYLSTLNCCDAVFVLNPGQKLEYLKMVGLKTSDKIMIIPNGVDNSRIQNNKAKENIVLWVGTFDYAIKRPDYMLKIWAGIEKNFPAWKLYLLGDGPSLNEMKELAARLVLKNVVFTGRVNPSDYYAIAKISCITSVHESFSLVTVESQINRTVPILFDSFTAASMIVDNMVSGILVKPFDTEQFKEMLALMMRNESLYENMSTKAYDAAQKFSLENTYNKWISTLKLVKYE